MTVKVIIDNYDVSNLVQSATLSGDSVKFNRSLSLSLRNTIDGRKQAVKFEEGAIVTFNYGIDSPFIGVLFAQEISQDGTHTITAYDSNVYLSKSTSSNIFVNKKASDIIRLLARDFDVELGEIADTGYVIPYLRLSNMTLYDMILKALTITRNQTGKRYFVGNKGGKLTLTQGASKTRYVFMDGQNLLSVSYSRSIEDTRTQVKVVGGDKGKETVVVVKDEEKRKKYGVLQVYEEMDEKATPSQIKQRAQTLLKERSVVNEQLSVEVLGVPEVDVGTPVYVINEMTATNGAYYVTSVSHNFIDGAHTMSLELTRTYELPDIEINSEEVTRK